jgi:hypothetical protein
VKDTRSPAHRLAQAHLDLLLGYLDAGDGPSTGRQVPHITMTIDFDALTQAVSAAALDFGGPVGPRRTCAGPWRCGTAAAPGPAATARLAGAMPITSSGGSMAAKPVC